MTKKTMAHTLVKRSLIAGAVLATAAGHANAQSSVTIYGRLDNGVRYTSKAPNGEKLTDLANGGMLPSIWGFKGSEDLGGGVKAVFNLEGDFDGSTGGSRGLGSISSNLFGRQANVGLSGGFGTVLLGRQYSPALLADLGTEPRGYRESYSSLLTFAATQLPGGNELGPNNAGGIFTSNLVSYSNAFGPVNVGIGYGFGEVAGESSQGDTVALGVSYNGPITVSGSYQQISGLGVGTNAETKRYSLGVSVPIGAITLKGYYAKATEDNAAGTEISDTNNYGVGAQWAWNPQNLLLVSYYYGKDDATAAGEQDKNKTLVVTNEYSFSKRTTLYGTWAYVDSDTSAALTNGAAGTLSRTSVVLDATQRGEKAHILHVGLKHDF